MANSSPPWVDQVLVAIDVGGTPTVPAAANEAAGGGVGRYSGTALVYQTVKAWTVTAGKVGKLAEISIVTSDYAKTMLRLNIAGVLFMNDCQISTGITIPFNDLTLAAGAVVTLSAESTDGTAIVVDGEIAGREVG
jgi:hypothetical protein